MNITIGQPLSFSQIGRRDNQEDARYPNVDAPQDAAPFFLVCDGVGGCDKGEVASNTVCKTFADALRHTDWDKPFTADNFLAVLDKAYEQLNRIANDDNRDMATTLTFVCFHVDGVLVAHIGDSRIYHVRPGVGILYRSEDHSLVNALVHSGNITPEEAEHHPQSNVITRCISVTTNAEERSRASILRITDLRAGDYFFLCSDGVLESLPDDKLLSILSRPADKASDEDKLQEIKTLCRASHDNNTAYLIPIDSVLTPTDDEAADADPTPTDDEAAESVETHHFTQEPEQVRDVHTPAHTATATSSGNKLLSFLKSLFR